MAGTPDLAESAVATSGDLTVQLQRARKAVVRRNCERAEVHGKALLDRMERSIAGIDADIDSKATQDVDQPPVSDSAVDCPGWPSVSIALDELSSAAKTVGEVCSDWLSEVRARVDIDAQVSSLYRTCSQAQHMMTPNMMTPNHARTVLDDARNTVQGLRANLAQLSAEFEERGDVDLRAQASRAQASHHQYREGVRHASPA